MLHTVLLVATRRQRHYQMGRCTSDRGRRTASSNREQLLGDYSQYTKDTLSRNLLYESIEQMYHDCGHHILDPETSEPKAFHSGGERGVSIETTFRTIKGTKSHQLLREAIGIHTCDRRSSKTDIQREFPKFTFEPGFAEIDPLWKADVRETNSALDARMKALLDDVFSNDDSTFVSFSSHSGAIGGLLRVLGHRDFRLVTGAIIPVLVKAENMYSAGPSTPILPSTPAPTCTANPTPSVS